jgi:hypothetical protein
MKTPKRQLNPIQNYFRFMRNIYGEDLLEDFLISTVASVLVIRLFLSLTGYPQLGGGGLHIAHMLWGGLFMLAAIFILLGFLSRPAHELAAVIGGLGFGAFIDEVGKYVTNDNNYFFQPTVAIIYVTLILVYLAVRMVFDYKPLTKHENLANVFEIIKQASVNGLDSQEEERISTLLAQCTQDDPLVKKLREMLPHIRVVKTRLPHLLDRVENRLYYLYQGIVNRWWFGGVVIAFFAFTTVTGFSYVTVLIAWLWTTIIGVIALFIVLVALLQFWRSRIPNLQVPLSVGVVVITILMMWAILVNPGNVSLQFVEWALFACSSVSSVFTIIGIILMARSRLKAYRMFQFGTVISVLLTQVFAFYQYQFYALIGLFLSILLLLALRFMINRELVKTDKEAAPA